MYKDRNEGVLLKATMPRTGIHNRLGNLKQENPMNVNLYIGFDVVLVNLDLTARKGTWAFFLVSAMPATRKVNTALTRRPGRAGDPISENHSLDVSPE
jgi:hypothetical protein